MRRLCAFCLPVILLIAHLGARAEVGEARCRYVKLTTLPISLAGLQPTVEGTINGKRATMLLDTGAYQTTLTRTVVERLGLSTGHLGGSSVGLSGESSHYRAWIEDMSIGPVRRGGANFPVVWDMTPPPAYDALVGADFLFQHDLEIALADRQASFFHPVGCEGAFLAYWDRNASVVPLEEITSRDSRRSVTVRINGQRVRALVDSGATRSSFDLTAAARAGVTPQSPGVVRFDRAAGGVGKHPITYWVATFDTFSIGDETVRNAQIVILDKWAAAQDDLKSAWAAEWLRDEPEMTLGADFLRAHRVLFALSQHRLYFSYLRGKVFSADPAPAASQEKAGK